MTLHRPRQWGACWLALELWRELRLDAFWRERLPQSREGTRWDLVLTARSVLEKFAAIQMIDLHLPTTDGCALHLSRYTQPEKETQMLLEKLKLELPLQPPPKISARDASKTA